MIHKKRGNDQVLDVVFVLDRSGSMDVIRSSTISAFNRLIDNQRTRKDAGTTHLSLFLFSDDVSLVWNGVPLTEVEYLSYQTYVPSGNTALYDALGRAITMTDQRRCTASSRKDHEVIIATISDAIENSSYQYTFNAIRAMIRQKITDCRWDFLYLGPDELSRHYAIKLGFPEENVEMFPVTDQGIHDSCTKISDAITRKKEFHLVSGWKGEDTSQCVL